MPREISVPSKGGLSLNALPQRGGGREVRIVSAYYNAPNAGCAEFGYELA